MLMLAFLITGMVSCTKTMDVNPDGTIERHLAKTPVTTTLTLNSPVIVGDPVTFSAATSPAVTCGKITLEKWNTDSLKWFAVDGATNMGIEDDGSASYTINEAASTDAGSYRFHYIASGQCEYSEEKSNGAELIVNESCTGLVLTIDKTTGNCSTGAYSITYTVKACGGNYTNLKLQGGLVSGAIITSTTPTATISTKKGSNSVITWNVGTLLQGQTASYTVNFTKVITVENQNITGNWSVKGKDANNAEAVAGYNNAVTASPCVE
jgi:hypothetical protein